MECMAYTTPRLMPLESSVFSRLDIFGSVQMNNQGKAAKKKSTILDHTAVLVSSEILVILVLADRCCHIPPSPTLNG